MFFKIIRLITCDFSSYPRNVIFKNLKSWVYYRLISTTQLSYHKNNKMLFLKVIIFIDKNVVIFLLTPALKTSIWILREMELCYCFPMKLKSSFSSCGSMIACKSSLFQYHWRYKDFIDSPSNVAFVKCAHRSRNSSYHTKGTESKLNLT